MPIETLVKNVTRLPDKYVEMAVSYIQFLQAQYQQEQQSTGKNGKEASAGDSVRQVSRHSG